MTMCVAASASSPNPGVRVLRQLIVVAALMLVVMGSAGAQRQKGMPTASDSANYDSLLTRIVAGDTTADFTTFRTLAAKITSTVTRVTYHFRLVWW